MSDRTYTEWRKRVEKEARDECKKQSMNWDDMTALSHRISKLMKDNKGSLSENGIISRFYDPVTGFYFTFETMKVWQGTVSKIQQVCVDDGDGHLFECPGEVTNGRRWLFMHEDIMMLLFTILALYEGPYKNIINLLYDGTNDKRFNESQIDERINHLANRYGIDIRHAMSRELRNSVAHMSFRLEEQLGRVVIRFTNKGKMESDCVYTHEKLHSIYTDTQDALWLLYGAVLHWWKLEYGPMRLFDDMFFRTKNGEAVRRAALLAMLQPGSQNIEVWKKIVERFRRELATKTS